MADRVWGENVTVTLLVLCTLTGNRRAQAPRKAIILRALQAKEAYTRRLSHAHIHAQPRSHKVKSGCVAVTTLIGLCNCLGRFPALWGTARTDLSLHLKPLSNMDVHCHDIAIQLNMCVYICLSASYSCDPPCVSVSLWLL